MNLCFRPVGNETFHPLRTDAIILTKISDQLPPAHVNTDRWTQLCNIQLADPGFNRPNQIDILFGADIFPNIFLEGNIKTSPNEPHALKTILDLC